MGWSKGPCWYCGYDLDGLMGEPDTELNRLEFDRHMEGSCVSMHPEEYAKMAERYHGNSPQNG